MKHIILLALTFCYLTSLDAQSNSQYAVSFFEAYADPYCDYVDIGIAIKAHSGYPPFFLADQNYRFSFDPNILENPRMGFELEISGNYFENDFSAFFAPHHLNGSLDTIVSYNVVLEGGTGYLIDDSRWYPVGTVRFDMVTGREVCFVAKWHTQAPEDFPPTYINEKYGGISGTLNGLDEGTYEDIYFCRFGCLDDPFEPDEPNIPIELATFQAKEEDCFIAISWTTATETNNDYFLVEKSIDGIDWLAIGKIDGAGTALDANDYLFYDKRVSQLTQYYRLRQIDFDGQSTSSEAIAVHSSCIKEGMENGITELFPNPASSGETINFTFYSPQEGSMTLVIADKLGRTLAEIPKEFSAGKNLFSFQANLLVPGLYFARIEGEGWYSGVKKFAVVD